MSSTLLVVEPSLVVTVLVKKTVLRNDPEINLFSAENGKSGIKIAKNEKPDLILLAWAMPDFDGKYFLEELHKDSNLSSIPVLLHTSIPEDSIKINLESYPNIKEFIKKPLAPSKLYIRLEKYLVATEGS